MPEDVGQERRPAPKAIDPKVAEVVPIIGCSGCGGATFELTNDKRVICAKCHGLINSIRWFDVNDLPPAV